MHRMLAAVLVLWVAAAAWGAPAGVAVRGDAQAWEEVAAAQARLETVPSYRIRAAVAREAPIRMTMLTEVVNPDRRRVVVELPEYTAEAIIVGRQVASRQVSRTGQPAFPQPSVGPGDLLGAFLDPIGFATGFLVQAAMNAMTQAVAQRRTGWRCQTLEAGGGAQAPPELEVEVARLPQASLGGAPVRVYRMVWRIPGQPASEQRLSVGADGLPRRLEWLQDGKPMMTEEYGDFGAPIQIELPPPCRQ